MLTAERLRELLTYDPETGLFRWRINHAPRARVGQCAGTLDSHGYTQIKIDRVPYLAHRLAWLYIHGSWPSGELDHRYGYSAGDQLANLRECVRHQNCENIPLRKDNTSGATGVSWFSQTQRWKATIQKNGRRQSLGYFKTKEEAKAAYLEAKKRVHAFQPVPRDLENWCTQ